MANSRMRVAVGPLSFCHAEECSKRSSGASCSQSGLWKNRSFAESYVAQLRRNPAALGLLRSMLSKNGLGSGAPLNQDAILKLFAGQLASGRLRVCQAPASSSTAVAGDPATTSATSAAPSKPFPLTSRSQKSQSTSTAPDQPAAFPADVELAALANVLAEAARTGAPFCEECMKAAQAAQGR